MRKSKITPPPFFCAILKKKMHQLEKFFPWKIFKKLKKNLKTLMFVYVFVTLLISIVLGANLKVGSHLVLRILVLSPLI
jgi:hypothetical protein